MGCNQLDRWHPVAYFYFLFFAFSMSLSVIVSVWSTWYWSLFELNGFPLFPRADVRRVNTIKVWNVIILLWKIRFNVWFSVPMSVRHNVYPYPKKFKLVFLAGHHCNPHSTMHSFENRIVLVFAFNKFGHVILYRSPFSCDSSSSSSSSTGTKDYCIHL